MRDERSVTSVPGSILVLLTMALLVQLFWHGSRPAPQATATALPAPPTIEILRLIGLNDPPLTSRAVMLWLQAFDNQPGLTIPFNKLDYDKVIQWLDICLQLDQRSQYPLLAASRLYSQVPDKQKKRKMLEFVYSKFFQDPDKRWVWLAHAIYVAKYQLDDLDTALKYANAIRLHAASESVPFWARHMEVYILEDLGDIEAAKILIGGLLDSGAVNDSHEIMFLQMRLQSLQEDQM